MSGRGLGAPEDTGSAPLERARYPSATGGDPVSELGRHPRRGRAGGMELDGLLLDEEGTFSLSGFQDFTVSVPRGTPTGVRCPRPSLCSALCLRRPLGLCCLVL